MADPLAEMLNRVGASPQTAQPIQPVEPHWTQKLANALGAVAQYGNPVTAPIAYLKEALNGTFVQNERERVGQLARIPTDVVGGALSLPNLPDTLSQVFGGPKIGRIDALDTASDAVHETGKNIGEAIAGKPLNDSLIEGTPAELNASWARLLAGAAIPIPGSWQAKMSGALQKVSAGNATVDAIASTAAKTMEILTPLTLDSKAAVPNIAIAGTLAPALELAVANQQQAKADVKAGGEQVKGALDVAAQGAKEARDATAQHVVQAGMLPSTGDPITDIAIGTSLLGATVLAGARFNMMGRVFKNADKAETYNSTRLGFLDKLESQGGDRVLPLSKTLGEVLNSQGNPSAETQRIRFREESASRQGASVDMRLQSVYTDGTLPDSKLKFEPIQNLFSERKNLSEEEQALLGRAILSTEERNYRLTHKMQRANLLDVETQELEANINQARANPRMNYLMDKYFETTSNLNKYMPEQGRMTLKEANDFKKNNPYIVASRVLDTNGGEGRWLNPSLVKKNNGTGFRTFDDMGDPYLFLPRYIDEVVRSTEGKKIQRDYFIPMIRARDAGDPIAKEILGHTIDKPPSGESAGLYVHWRDPSGNSKWTRVNDSYVRAAAHDVTNPSALQLHKGLGDILADAASGLPYGVGKPVGLLRSKMYQDAAVGASAAVTGSPFSPVSLKYTATSSSAMRPAGIASGPIDKIIQDMTQDFFGKKIGLPGAGYAEMPWHIFNAAESIRAMLMQRGAGALRNSIIQDGPLSKLFNVMGPNTAEATANALASAYKRHAASDLRQSGIMGPSAYMSIDPALAFKQAEQMVRGGVLKETGQFVLDMLHAVTSAPALTMYKANKEMLNDVNSKARLMNAIRTMSGDPGASGLYSGVVGKGIAHTVNTIPWANSGLIQPGFKLLRSFRENPQGTVAGIFNIAVVPAIVTTLWNASQGPDYADHQFNIRPPERTASHYYIGVPGKAPDQGVEFALDPAFRPFKILGEMLAGHILGIANGELFGPENEVALNAVRHMSQHRWGSLGPDSIPRAAINQAIMPPVPNIVQLPFAMAGMPIRDWLGEATPRNDKQQSGFTEGAGPQGQSFMHKYGPAWLEDALRSIGAMAASNIYHMLDDTLTRRFSGDMGRSEPNQSTSDALYGGVVQNFGRNLRNSAKEGTPLFNSYLSISPSKESAAVAVKEKLDGLRKFAEAYGSATMPGGNPQDFAGNKRIGFTEYTGISPMQPQDAVMAALGREAGRIYQQLSTVHGASIKALYEDRQSIQSSNKFSPDEKLGKMNARAYEIVMRERALLADIERYENGISANLGVPVKFDKMNLNRGSGQFK